MVIVPALGSCSYFGCRALPDVPGDPGAGACDAETVPGPLLLVHDTWTVSSTGEVRVTGSCTVEPSGAGPSGSWMETETPPSIVPPSLSSAIVPVAVSVAVTVSEAPETFRLTVKVSSASSSVSSMVATVKLRVSPAVPVKVSAAVFAV